MSRYRAATICRRGAQRARVTDLISPKPHAAAGRTPMPRSLEAGHCRMRSARLLRRRDKGGSCMSAVDFSEFVDHLATVSGQALLPFFRTSLMIENKDNLGGFDPVTE